MDDYEDDESLYPNSEDEYEEDEVDEEAAASREKQQLPVQFFQEELGPPDISEQSLQALDEQATVRDQGNHQTHKDGRC